MSRRLPAVTFLLLLAVLRAAEPVSYQRLLQAAREPGNWLLYSGNYASHRHSRLAQITAANVRKLQPLWVYQFRTAQKVETSPLAVDDVLYLTSPPNDVVALDAATGRKLWSYEYKVPDRVPACCGVVNRGLAILDGRLFMATVDAYLVALDLRSGRLLWKTKLADYEQGYSATSAPLVIRDKVLLGVSGGEYGVRGFLDAYDAATGQRAWRFYTVPGPGDPGFDTWAGDSWKTGGAPAWLTGSYDAELNLAYFTTGNPGPDWNGEARAGDNLYSNSVLALQPDTGKLVWHFQFTPHDIHDWDATQIPVLADAVLRGRPRKLLLHANRNGFFYALDRASGEFLLAKPFVKQTWAKGIDDRGRPIRLPDTAPSLEGTKLWPGVNGGTNWYSPSYSPATGLFYVAAQEQGTVYFTASAEYRPGSLFLGGTNQPAERGYGAVRALVPATGEVRWEHRLVTPPWAGLLSTAGNLVFGGTEEGNFFALDARTGQHLWSYPAGGRIIANPISYLSRGRQYVAIAAGDLLVAFGLGPE
jgi:alcohol dehydrogenase (cytochrome c)